MGRGEGGGGGPVQGDVKTQMSSHLGIGVMVCALTCGSWGGGGDDSSRQQ